jgi:hypothetical protein
MRYKELSEKLGLFGEMLTNFHNNTSSKYSSDDARRYAIMLNMLKLSEWQENQHHPWLDKASKTDPSYKLRLVKDTNCIFMISDTPYYIGYDIPENVYGELSSILEEIGDAIKQVEKQEVV